ncbi:MAG TPA: ASKHA domain-containing protein [Bauldia sp.]|nr:ASKHA domain-containing protein [Bauldia sp.]
MPDRLVVFTPSGKRGHFPDGTTLLEAARKLGADLDSVCGGRGICGRCQVEVAEGQFPKHGIESRAGNVSGWNRVEQRYADIRGVLKAGRRLGCQAHLHGDVVVDIPAESQVHRQVVRKDADSRPISLDPVVTLHYVEVAEPDMHDPASDFRRLGDALRKEWGIADPRAGNPVLATLQETLRAGGWKVTAALREGSDIVGLWPGLVDRVYGVAVDIGSTTVAAHLADLTTGETLASAGIMNPQIRFGEDLMSRVSYAMLNPGGDREMTAAIRAAVAGLVAEVAAEAKVDPGLIVEMTAVGNPIMHHLYLGFDPVELGGAPFALTVDQPLDTPARDLGLAIAPGAVVHTLPLIAGHVGADAAGMILAEAPYNDDEITLLVDVGTNAEIVLGNRSRLLACSSPTGPAFEGAQISSGQRAAPGAIERLRIDPATLEPRYRVIGCELWSDEPGFDAAVAATGVTGICGSGIIEAVAELFLAGIVTADGVIDGATRARTPRVVSEGRTFTYVIRDGAPRIAITQGDIRAIQLAKAALYAGIRLLMDHYPVSRVDRIVLAGAFGSHIDVKYAMALGLIPDCPLGHVRSAGNAAGTGARIALLNAASRREIAGIARHIVKIETALEPRFQEHFVAAMAIPHRTDAFPNLAAVVTLPARAEPVPERRRRRGGGNG